MDFTLFEDVTSISAIYKDALPTLTNIEVVKITILTGEETELILTLDTIELPETLPAKWLQRNVNTIQFEFDFIDVDIKKFCLSKGMNYSFIIQYEDNMNVIILKNLSTQREITFKSKWMYIKRVCGYRK